jgi:hypothetical protein
MGWSFRRRIKIIPGVSLNISKSGISTSIGVKGASLNFGPKGVRMSASIPSIGLYGSQKISSISSKKPKIENFSEIVKIPTEIVEVNNIFSADIFEITSQNMQGIKEAIILAHEQKKGLKNDLVKVKNDLFFSKLKLIIAYIFIYGFVLKKKKNQIKEDIETQRDAVAKIKEQIENSYVILDIEFDEYFLPKFQKVVESFEKLTKCVKIWDTTGENYQDRVKARSSASRLVSKKEVTFSRKDIPDMKSKFQPFYFKNANGADFYFYPSFIIMYSSIEKFAIIGYNEFLLKFTSTPFVETGKVPSDSKVIDRTWAKVNKNGTPDKRFKSNYQIPIVKYGCILLKTDTGINEEYGFSNYEYSEEFSNTFIEYQQIVKSLKTIES